MKDSTFSPEGRELVLGIDPGLRVTGYGLVARSGSTDMALVEAGTLEGGGPTASMATRLRNLYVGMDSLVAEYRPRAVAMEQLYSHYAHPRTAILMAHAR